MKSSQGVVFKRRQNILKALQEKRVILVEDLAKELNVSEITIRRDLQSFDDQHLIERFYGGARLIEGAFQKEEFPAVRPQRSKKQEIAKLASTLVHDQDMICINSGSTAFLLLNYLADRNVTIITNNGRAIFRNPTSKAEVVLSGGEIYEKKKSLVGDFALHTFSRVTANICFLGVGGINEKGISTFALPETAVNKLILERTNGPRIVVAEGSKVGREHNFFTADISLITHLITDHSADKEQIKKIEAKGVKVLFVSDSNDAGEINTES
jgi:DeoR family transcriptional regulator, fructose operon transcriptional repressor